MKNLNPAPKKLWLIIAIFGNSVCMTQVVYAEGAETKSKMGDSVNTQSVRVSPAFQEVDKNGDHYVTKAELKGYPYLLKHFDKVDAGENGRLEDHEYENLLMEKEREKGQ